MANLEKLRVSNKSDEGSWLQIEYPDSGEPIEGMRIRLLGEGSVQAQKHARKVIDRRLKTRFRKGRDVEIKSEDLDREAIDHLVQLVVEWEGFEDGDDNPIPCTPENVKAVLGDPNFRWMREQVQDFVEAMGNFFRTGG